MPQQAPVTRHEEVEELLGGIPHWIIRWGITLIFFLLLMVIIAAQLIKYPDIVKGSFTLTTPTPPVELVSQINGTIEKVYIADNAWVNKDTIIAKITSPVSEKAVKQLNLFLAEIQEMLSKPKRQHHINFQSLPKYLDALDDKHQLGLMQESYSNLRSLFQDYLALAKRDKYIIKKKGLESKISSSKKLTAVIKQQILFAEKALVNEEEKYKAYKALYVKGCIAKMEFLNREASYWEWQQKLEEQKKTLLNNKIAINDYVLQLQNLKFEYEEQSRKLETAIAGALQSVQKCIYQWEKDYVIKAPIKGLLKHLSILSKEHYVKMGEALFTLLPKEEPYVVHVQVSPDAYGKVQIGQRARIKLTSYPFQEYGYLPGQVKEISSMPHQGRYKVTLELEQGATSIHGKELPLKPAMEGYAEIITRDASLLKRITRKFLHSSNK